MRAKFKVWALVALFCLGGLARGQGEAKLSAQLGSGVLKLGERTSISIVLEGVRDARVASVPAVEGLVIGAPSGPSARTYESFINGRRRSSYSLAWSIPVRPTAEGEYEIPPIEVEYGGKRYSTTPLHLKVVEDMRGEELGFLEVRRTSSTPVVEGMPFTIEIRFGWDESLANVNFADLSLSWWGELPGTIELEREFPPPGARVIQSGVSVNSDEVVTVEEVEPIERDGRAYRVLRLQRSLIATRPGLLEFPDAFLNFGRAEERGSFFQRRNVKVQDFYVRAPRFYVDVKALSKKGQPFDFTGAIGSIAAQASVDSRDVDVGDSMKLTVEWTGEANFEFFEAPDIGRLDAFDGFRVYGKTEEKSYAGRTTTYDLAPVSEDVDEIPPVPLPVYDAGRGAYVTVETEPIAIRVRPLAGAVELEGEDKDDGTGRDIRDVDTRPLARGRGSAADAPLPTGAVIAALFGVPILWVLARTAVRRRSDPAAPLERRRRGARRRLRRALAAARTSEDELKALQRFLAERSREHDLAWVGRDTALGVRAATNGGPPVDDDAARELADLMERLEAAVWAGDGGGSVEKSEVLRVADRLIGGGL